MARRLTRNTAGALQTRSDQAFKGAVERVMRLVRGSAGRPAMSPEEAAAVVFGELVERHRAHPEKIPATLAELVSAGEMERDQLALFGPDTKPA